MSEIITAKCLQDLSGLLNDKNLLEVVVRGKGAKYKTFQKVALDNVSQGEVQKKLESAIALMNKNNQIGSQVMQGLNVVQGLQIFNLVLSGVNLCATCGGFAIMYSELEGIKSQIENVVKVQKNFADIETNFKFNHVLSEHNNMLDCRKKQKLLSEPEMRKLVDDEYNVLRLLMEVFEKDVTNDRREILFSILSLATMFATSIKYFDEIYYFNNRETIESGSKWHNAHNNWTYLFDKLASDEYVKRVQDLAYFEMGLDTHETDLFYIGYVEQIAEMRQGITDNQTLIIKLDDIDDYHHIENLTTEEVKEGFKSALIDAGISADSFDDVLQYAVA